MKKFKIAALLMCFVALSMTMTSCTKSNEELILGSWKCTQVTGSDASVSVGVGDLYTFNEDKTMSASISVLGLTVTANGTYAIDDENLTIQYSATGVSVATKMTIKTLDKSALVISDSDNELTLTFAKQ